MGIHRNPRRGPVGGIFLWYFEKAFSMGGGEPVRETTDCGRQRLKGTSNGIKYESASL